MTTPARPPGGPIELPGRGTTFHRDQPSRAGGDAPTVLLLPGWTATADLRPPADVTAPYGLVIRLDKVGARPVAAPASHRKTVRHTRRHRR